MKTLKGPALFLAQNDFPGWAVLEWKCGLKQLEDGAREGTDFIRRHLIRASEHLFDNVADSGVNPEALHRLMGLGSMADLEGSA